MDGTMPARTLRIRDEFAALFLQAIIAKDERPVRDTTPSRRLELAKIAADYADALCEVLARQ